MLYTIHKSIYYSFMFEWPHATKAKPAVTHVTPRRTLHHRDPTSHELSLSTSVSLPTNTHTQLPSEVPSECWVSMYSSLTCVTHEFVGGHLSLMNPWGAAHTKERFIWYTSDVVAPLDEGYECSAARLAFRSRDRKDSRVCSIFPLAPNPLTSS